MHLTVSLASEEGRPSEQRRTNLIVNGTFDTLKDPDGPDKWNVSIQDPAYSVHVDRNVFQGGGALRIEGTSTSGRALVVQTGIALEDIRGETLKLDAWYRGTLINAGSGSENFIRVEFFKQENGALKHAAATRFTHAPGNTLEWTLLEDKFIVPVEADYIWVSVVLRNVIGTSMWSGIKLTMDEVDKADVVSDIRDPGVFYVSPDGDDAHAGTVDAPWKTLAYVNGQASPGDTIMFFPGTYEGVLRPTQSGTREAPITFKALERRSARIAGDAGAGYALQLIRVEHVRIEGLHVKTTSDIGRWLLVENAKHIHIDDVLMEDARGSMPFLITDSEQIHVRNSVIRRYIGGNMARVSHSSRILFEGNAISRTGHSPLQFYPVGSNQYVVVRGNVFHPAWGRAFEFFATRDLLFEGNIVTNSYDGGRSADPAAKILSKNSIFRFNRIFRNWGGPIHASPGENWTFRNVRLYNNVFDDNLDYALSNNISSDNVGNVKYVNNVFYRNDVYGDDRQIRFSGAGRPEIAGDGKLIPRIDFLRNVVVANDPDVKSTLDYNGQSLGIEIVESRLWSTISTSTKAVRFEGNMDAPPRFVDEENYNHALSPDSPLMNNGYFLTTAVGSGESHVVPVEDAGFFYDGFGIDGEMGDLISIGFAGQTARVIRVDRSKNELTLDRIVHWDDGAPVSFPWSGDGPDIGAFEHGKGGRPSVQVISMPYIVRPGEDVALTVNLHGIDDPTEIRWQLGDGTLAFDAELVHRYAEAYDYPIRVQVTTSSGNIYRGTAYVVVEELQPTDQPLVHTTFDSDDADWWWLWKSYRPEPTDWERELDRDTGNGVLRISNPGDGTMPLRLAPTGWDADRYPWIYLRYRVSPGTPVGFYLEGFSQAGSSKRKWIAAVPREGRDDARHPIPYELIDDGTWQVLLIDVRTIREDFPEVDVLKRFGSETMSRSKQGDTYWLDEVVILPLDAVNGREWHRESHEGESRSRTGD